MDEALSLARAMQGFVWPNPAVGCVIVRDGMIVGRGQTQFGGRPHAERVALDDAGECARGSALYVTLEPCCHWGKTPPCVDAIIAAGVASVHAALQDPDPRVNGGGFRRLQEAGLHVTTGLGAAAARRIMEGFFARVTSGRPLVTLANVSMPDDDVPEPFDAVLATLTSTEVSLTMRSAPGRVRMMRLSRGQRAVDLARRLGEEGLTSVLIPASDPLARSWSVAGLVDHNRSAASTRNDTPFLQWS